MFDNLTAKCHKGDITLRTCSTFIVTMEVTIQATVLTLILGELDNCLSPHILSNLISSLISKKNVSYVKWIIWTPAYIQKIRKKNVVKKLGRGGQKYNQKYKGKKTC